MLIYSIKQVNTDNEKMIHPMIKSMLVLVTAIMAFPVIATDRITVNGLFKDKAIITIDGIQRVLEKGKKSREGALLIKADSKQAVIEIDGRQQLSLIHI